MKAQVSSSSIGSRRGRNYIKFERESREREREREERERETQAREREREDRGGWRDQREQRG